MLALGSRVAVRAIAPLVPSFSTIVDKDDDLPRARTLR
jgi:hypothetical protein